MDKPIETKTVEVTVDDMILIVKFIANMDAMKRISDAEREHLKPSFERMLTFCNTVLANHQNSLVEVSDEEIDVTEVKSSKKDKKNGKKEK